MNNIYRNIATLWFFGFAPKGPGTVGSIVALILAVPLLLFLPFYVFVALFVILTALGFYCADLYAKQTGINDPKEVVIDELAGLWLTLLFINPHIWWHWLLAFSLFRLFDIIKPFPIDYLDKKLHGGIGIMVDDLVAGIFSVAVFQLVLLFVNGSL